MNAMPTIPRDSLPTIGRGVWATMLLLVVMVVGAGTAAATRPAHCAAADDAQILERLITRFMAEQETDARRRFFADQLQPAPVGLSFEELEAMRERREPVGLIKADRLWQVQLPGAAENPRGWFNLALPPEYDPIQPYPIAVILHDAKQTGDDLVARFVPRLTRAGFIVVLPTTLAAQRSWASPGESANLYRVLDFVSRRYRLDHRRMVLSGAGMGGIGVLTNLTHHPDIWAAGAEVGGIASFVTDDGLGNLRGVPLYLLHSAGDVRGDGHSPIDDVHQFSARLNRLRIDHKFAVAPAIDRYPPDEHWQTMNQWLIDQPAKPWSPRPMFVGPTDRTIGAILADPFGLNSDDPLASTTRLRLEAGQHIAARLVLEDALQANPRNARLMALLAVAWLPEVSDPLSDEVSHADMRKWHTDRENQTLQLLNHALKAGEGKGGSPDDFDAALRMLIARIWAKRTLMQLHIPTDVRANYHEAFLRQVRAILRHHPTHEEALRLMRLIDTRIADRFH